MCLFYGQWCFTQYSDYFLPLEIVKENLTTVSLQDEIDSQFPYKWLLGTMVHLCFMFGIISVIFLFKHYRRRQETVNADVTYLTATPQADNTRAYSSCNKKPYSNMEFTENEQNLQDKLPTCTKENVYITIL